MSDNQLLGAALSVGFVTVLSVVLERGTALGAGPEARRNEWNSYQVLREADSNAGKFDGKFVLVEFGDYQCPPCRAAFPKVEALLRKRRGRLSFVFRHFPLTQIHPRALAAATFAEAVRERGRFDDAHRLLYSDPHGLDAKALEHYRAGLGLEDTRLDLSTAGPAGQRVKRDMDTAARLKLSGTPSFILCSPDGRAEAIELSQKERTGCSRRSSRSRSHGEGLRSGGGPIVPSR